MDTSTFIIAAFIGGALAGAFLGLFPLILGWMFDYKKMGLIGFGTCIACGLILGFLLAGPVSLGFTVYIAKQIKGERKSKVESYDF
ncbi:MAG: hypothetical protein AAF846_15945 [Chloroflexota bacterium]